MLKLTHIFPLLALILTVTVCGSSGESAGTDLGPADPRCDALCDDSDTMCTTDVATCKSVCQVRVANLPSLCSACLLEGSNGGTCGGGGTCCPHASFPKGVLDCTAACRGSEGVNPSGDHPICTSICSNDDPACSADVATCFDACRARIRGVSGLCALCLLDDAHGGACGGGGPCCPRPVFDASANACAAVCN